MCISVHCFLSKGSTHVIKQYNLIVVIYVDMMVHVAIIAEKNINLNCCVILMFSAIQVTLKHEKKTQHFIVYIFIYSNKQTLLIPRANPKSNNNAIKF